MMQATHTSKWYDYPHYGNIAYKIEIVNDRINPLQRHIWKKKDGTIKTEEWINGIYYSKDMERFTQIN